MGNSKDGKLGIEIGNVIQDVDKITQVKIPGEFYKDQVALNELRTYPMFKEYDEFAMLKPVILKDNWGEIIQICCGENYTIMLSNFGELFACGSNQYGQLGCESESEGEDGDQGDEGSEDSSDEELVIPKELQQ